MTLNRILKVIDNAEFVYEDPAMFVEKHIDALTEKLDCVFIWVTKEVKEDGTVYGIFSDWYDKEMYRMNASDEVYVRIF